MRILVQKFGGSSLTTVESRDRVIKHIQREQGEGYSVVVVVSAMGRLGDPYATDTLLQLVQSEQEPLSARELDLLLCCGETISAMTLCAALKLAGIKAVAFTGAGAGITTDNEYGKAKIKKINPERVLAALEDGNVVVITGFQGMTEQGETVTLGRGGSDTSAAALGAALAAETVDIYTDVSGVLTADPRIVEGAKSLSVVSYAEISNMAREGAKVIHPRAVEIAKQARVALRIRSTFNDEPGTLVQDESFSGNEEQLMDRHVTGIAHFKGLTQLIVTDPNEQGEMPLKVFQTMAEQAISVDFIHVTPSKASFTIFDSDAERAMKYLHQIGFEPQLRKGCAKISVIGGGMNGQPGIMASIVAALSSESIPIMQSADSNTTIWLLVSEERMEDAVRALHYKFELYK